MIISPIILKVVEENYIGMLFVENLYVALKTFYKLNLNRTQTTFKFDKLIWKYISVFREYHYNPF